MAIKKKKSVDKKYQRSSSYRRDYIKWHPGIMGKFYICRYCGRIMTRPFMEVDHVIPVDYAKNSALARKMLPDGVNGKKNLVSACRYCNGKKSNKGGLWILRGYIGGWLQPAIWILLLIFLFAFTIYFFKTGMTSQDARDILLLLFRKVIETLVSVIQYIVSIFVQQ